MQAPFPEDRLTDGSGPLRRAHCLERQLVVYGSVGTNDYAEGTVNPKTIRIAKRTPFNCLFGPGIETAVVQQAIPNSTSNDVDLRLDHVNPSDGHG